MEDDKLTAPDAPPPLSPELAAAVADIEKPPPPPPDSPAPGATSPVAPGAMSQEDAARFARAGIDWVAVALVNQYPALAQPPAVGLADEATRERAAQLAGAVVAKRNLPDFLERWKEEFFLGVFLAGVAWESYKRIQAAASAPKPDAPADEGAPAAPGA